MPSPNIHCVYQIALHLAMTVIPLFTACPGTKLQALCPFGIFPFLMSSPAPGTSVTLLMKNATSISVSIFKKIITLAGGAVNCFEKNSIGKAKSKNSASSFDNICVL